MRLCFASADLLSPRGTGCWSQYCLAESLLLPLPFCLPLLKLVCPSLGGIVEVEGRCNPPAEKSCGVNHKGRCNPPHKSFRSLVDFRATMAPLPCKNKVTRWLRVLGSKYTIVLDETSKGAVSDMRLIRLYCNREHAKLHKYKTVTCPRKHGFYRWFVRTPHEVWL